MFRKKDKESEEFMEGEPYLKVCPDVDPDKIAHKISWWKSILHIVLLPLFELKEKWQQRRKKVIVVDVGRLRYQKSRYYIPFTKKDAEKNRRKTDEFLEQF